MLEHAVTALEVVKMSRYKMEDGTVLDTENAVQSWPEDTFHDGNNHISRATGTQWNHETLYKSRKGRYWTEHSSQWQGSHDRAEWESKESAAAWLLVNGHDLPDDLKESAAAVSE